MSLRDRTLDKSTRDELATEVARLTKVLRIAEDRLRLAEKRIEQDAEVKAAIFAVIDAFTAARLLGDLLLKRVEGLR